MKAEARSPSLRNRSLLIPTFRDRMRRLSDRAQAFRSGPGFHFKGERRKLASRG